MNGRRSYLHFRGQIGQMDRWSVFVLLFPAFALTALLSRDLSGRSMTGQMRQIGEALSHGRARLIRLATRKPDEA